MVVLVVASTGGATATPATQDSSAYAGTHVSFDTATDAVVDYQVGGETVLESVAVQSQSEADSSSDVSVGTDLSAMTDLDGSAVGVETTTDTQATVTADSGARLHAHDNERGILVVESGDESQYVSVNVSGSSTTTTESEDRVVVTTENGTEGVFIVVGDGDVTVNDEGNVTAALEEDSRLVFRAYEDGRSEADERQEELIANGTAAAEVHVMGSAESGGETAVDVVEYGSDTTVEVTERSENRIELTAERTEHEGRVIITSVSESAIESTDDLAVTVDGEAAVEASSYSELEAATQDGDTSTYMVRNDATAEGSTEVLVGVNHFSERTIAMQSGDDAGDSAAGSDDGSDGSDTDGSDSSDGSDESGAEAPGFGVGVSIVALLGAAALGRLRA